MATVATAARSRRPDSRRPPPRSRSGGSRCRRRTRSCSRSSSSPRWRRGSSRPAGTPSTPRARRSPARYQEVDSTPARILVDSLKAPINGLYGIEDPATKNVDFYNEGSLFGAIDVALFILVIGGFIGITMKTGAIQAGIARLVAQAARPRAAG